MIHYDTKTTQHTTLLRERGSAAKRGGHSTVFSSTECIRAVAARWFDNPHPNMVPRTISRSTSNLSYTIIIILLLIIISLSLSIYLSIYLYTYIYIYYYIYIYIIVPRAMDVVVVASFEDFDEAQDKKARIPEDLTPS